MLPAVTAGPGAAVAIVFAKEGADVTVYLEEHKDARETEQRVQFFDCWRLEFVWDLGFGILRCCLCNSVQMAELPIRFGRSILS